MTTCQDCGHKWISREYNIYCGNCRHARRNKGAAYDDDKCIACSKDLLEGCCVECGEVYE